MCSESSARPPRRAAIRISCIGTETPALRRRRRAPPGSVGPISGAAGASNSGAAGETGIVTGAAGALAGTSGAGGSAGGATGSAGSIGAAGSTAGSPGASGSNGAAGTGGATGATGAAGATGVDASADGMPACTSTPRLPLRHLRRARVQVLRRRPSTTPTPRRRCASQGMRLIRVDDEGENQWAYNGKVSRGLDDYMWIGADDKAVAGDWRWSDGTAFWTGKAGAANAGPVGGLFNAWQTGQPDHANTNEDCAGPTTQGMTAGPICPARTTTRTSASCIDRQSGDREVARLGRDWRASHARTASWGARSEAALGRDVRVGVERDVGDRRSARRRRTGARAGAAP